MLAYQPLSLLITLCLLLFSSLPSELFAQPKVVWSRNVQEAWKDSQLNRRPLLLYFRSPTARPCLEMERTTLLDPGVQSNLSAGFSCAVVDVTQNRNLATRYGVFRVPTTLILNSKAQEVSRIVTPVPPVQFIQAINAVDVIDIGAISAPKKTLFGQGEIYRMRFESLYGWKNDGSAADAQLQLSLVEGVDGRAFRVNYQLNQNDWSYVQFSKELDQSQYFRLPRNYTFVIQVAGLGGFNSIDLKLIDTDYDSFGVSSIPIPTDFKGHQFVITSDEIGYLWGEGNRRLDPIKIIQIAVTPDQARFESDGTSATIPKGSVYLDEFVILAGSRTEIQNDYVKK